MRKRRTARVMLFDEAGAILLIRFVVPREDGEFVFWALPGGEIEAGESEADAAVRELREELGIEVTVEGPVYRDANMFWHQGEMQDNVDFLFWARCGREEPRLTGVTVEEIEKSLTPIGGRLEPEDVAPLAVYLAGDEARMVTGQAWNVDGGMLMC